MKILTLSGKKQSGKNTAFNFLLGLEIIKSSLVRGTMTVTNKGQLWVSDLWGDEKFKGILDINRPTESMQRLRAELVDPFIKAYSFADVLKQDVCMGVLGLSREQCYGSDDQKNSATHLRWENMPGIITSSKCEQIVAMLGSESNDLMTNIRDAIVGSEDLNMIVRDGPMTAREVMQYVGTDIFRKMYGDVWVDSTIRRIQADGSEFAIITDCRFPNEVKATQEAGGKVVRFTRGPAANEDQHESETALDKDKYDWGNFNAVLDNAEMSVNEQNVAFHKLLSGWGWIDELKVSQSIPVSN